MAINQKFSWQWGPGGVRGWNHAAAAETAQTGLRRAKRHSEGKRERHWAISSQSGCTGPMGEGKGLGAAAFPFLSGWQDDASQGRRYFFLLLLTLLTTTSSSQQLFLNVLILFWYTISSVRILKGASAHTAVENVIRMSEYELCVEFKRTRVTCRLLVTSGLKTLKSSNACSSKGLNRTVEGL